MEAGKFHLGTTKIFLRTATQRTLDAAREEHVSFGYKFCSVNDGLGGGGTVVGWTRWLLWPFAASTGPVILQSLPRRETNEGRCHFVLVIHLWEDNHGDVCRSG